MKCAIFVLLCHKPSLKAECFKLPQMIQRDYHVATNLKECINWGEKPYTEIIVSKHQSHL